MTVSIIKRAGGGFSISIDSTDGNVQELFSAAHYFANNLGGVGLYLPTGLKILNPIFPEYWTVAGVTGFTTITSLCDALDALGISAQVSTATIIASSEMEIKNDVGNPIPAKIIGSTGNQAVVSLSGGLSVLDPVLADGTQKTQLVSASGVVAEVVQADAAKSNTNKVLLVQTIDAAGNVGTGGSAVDKAAFTVGSSKGSVIMGIMSADLVTAGTEAAVQINQNREQVVYNPPSTILAEYRSPTDFAVVYGGSTTTLTVTGAPFTVDDTVCRVTSIMYKKVDGLFYGLFNARGGVSISCSAGTITVAGAGTPFLATDILYDVNIIAQKKGYDPTTNTLKTIDQSPDRNAYVQDSIVDTVNVAASTLVAPTYYPSVTGMAMDGYRHLSFTGKYIDTVAGTIFIDATNDEDTTLGDWIQQSFKDTASDTTVNSYTTTNGVLSIKLDNFNFSNFRVRMITGSSSNTVIIKARRSN